MEKVYVDSENRYVTLDTSAPPAAPEDDALAAPRVPPAAPLPRNIRIKDAALGRENFDRWVFGDGVDREDWLRAYHWKLRVDVEEADRRHRLTRGEREKLELAGRGDIKRFLDRVEESRRAFEDARKDFLAGREVLGKARALSARGPFGGDCLFDKVLSKFRDERSAAGRARP